MGDEDELEPTLLPLLQSKTLQWIFVGGKGGVGKTTTSCSVAVQLARRRESVLILSTDPAHNLSDAFTQKFSHEPTRVNGFDNLFAMELDSSVRTSTTWKLQEDDELGLAKVIPELLSAFPGIDEAMGFAELMQAVQTMHYSVIVFDTAPTGHTLRLLSFPDLLEKAFKKFQALKDQMSGALGMFNAMTGGAGADEFTGKFDQMRAATLSVRELFRDPSRTTFVCVCIPEFLSVFETERLIQELSKQEIDASYIIVNQILFPLPECDAAVGRDLALTEAEQGELSSAVAEKVRLLTDTRNALEKSHNARRRMQSKYLGQIRDLYALDFHVVPMPLHSNEVRGLTALEDFGARLMEQRDLPILG